MSNTNSPLFAQRSLVQSTRGATSIQHAVVMVCVAIAGLGGFSTFGGAMSEAIGGDARSGAVATPAGGNLAGGMVVSREAGSIEAVANITKKLRGMDGTVREAWMAIGAPFTEAEAFKAAGVEPAKALLFYGPPGTGKTSLAREIAAESGVKFVSSTGSALLGGYIGQGSGHVAKLFAEARQSPGGAIVFIDEIDGLGSRTAEGNMGQFAASAINELLSHLDGLAANENIRVIAATNNPAVLDEALVRAGRFDRKIYIGPPSADVLSEILANALSKLPVARSVKLPALAERLRGYGPADIKAVVETAGRRALERVLLDESVAGEVSAAPSVLSRRRSAPPEPLTSFLGDDNYLMWDEKAERFRLSDDGTSLREPVWISDGMDAMSARANAMSDEERLAFFDEAQAIVDEESGRAAWLWSEGDGKFMQFFWDSLSDEQAQRIAKHFDVSATEEVRLGIKPDWTQKVQVGQADFDHALSVVRPSAVPEHMSSFQKVKLADVGGYDSVKERLRKGIERPIRNPEAYTNLGLKAVPKSALLYGPPGTGKTLIAKAVATELGANVFVIKPSDIRNGTPGSAARKIAEVFDRARRAKPAVVLLDELDSLAPARGTSSVVDNEIVNALLMEMQGMNGSSGVVLLGTTNRPDAIDPALLRSGRFSLKLEVPLPDEATRESILRVQTRGKKLGRNVDFAYLAKHSEGMSGADLEALVDAAGNWTIDNAPTRKSIPAEAFTKALKPFVVARRRPPRTPLASRPRATHS